MKIGRNTIGRGHPTYIVAELSANHRQDLNEAIRLVEAAKQSGADAVKLQTYRPDTLTIQSDAPAFRVEGSQLWDGRTLYDLYDEAYSPWEWTPTLKQVADRLDIDLFSSPFDPTAVDFLEQYQMPAYKVASFEIVDSPLLRRIARTGKPVIMSTGMATVGEIEEALQTLRAAGTTEIALLKCTSAYPAPVEEANLRTLPHMEAMFGVPVGLSDHTLGIAVPVVAVTMGATIIEKHFTFSREVKGPDSAFSLEPQEFRAMVDSIRVAEKAMGTTRFEPTDAERNSRRYRRSLFVIADVRAGEKFTADNVRSIRPAAGLHPRHLEAVIGRPATRDVERGTPLQWDLVG